MKAIVLHCKPGNRFHFGKYAPDDDTALNDSNEIMHSDTLFAALVNTWQETFGDAQELVDAFEKEQLKISSLLFCMKQHEKYIWFLPKPISFNLFDTPDYKSFRGIRYISKKVWETIQLPPDLDNEQHYKRIGKSKFVISEDEISVLPASISEEIKKEIIQSLALCHLITLPKVRVRDRPEEQGIYQLTVTEIADNTELIPDIEVHYYFLLDSSKELEEHISEKLEVILNILPGTGIGAERSTIGKIESIEIVDNWNILMPDSDNQYCASVSLFSPGETDLGKMIYFKTLMRGGRRLGRKDDKNNSYLKSARMVAEGAILHTDCKGCLVDVSPKADNTYLRHGKPLCLPVHPKWIPSYEQQ